MRTLAVLLMSVLASLAEDSLVKQGQAALDRDDPRTAIKLLESAVSNSPQDAEAHYLLGVAYGKRAEQPDVIDHATLARRTCREFEKAVSLDPNHADARTALVQLIRQAYPITDRTCTIEFLDPDTEVYCFTFG